MNEIILGDAYKLIKDVPDKSVDLIVTDPLTCLRDGTSELASSRTGSTGTSRT